MTTARTMTPAEHAQGYAVCPCGNAHVFRADVVRRLPDGYSGELCGECGLWMCAVDKLRPVKQTTGRTHDK